MSKMIELMIRAKQDIGVCELKGHKNHPVIMEYFESANSDWVKSDTVPWCAAAMSAWCKDVGLPVRSSLRARRWLNLRHHPSFVTIEDPGELEFGDIVVLWRNGRNSNNGHIALFEGLNSNYLYLFGGNQGNRVCTKRYRDRRFLAGFRYEGKDNA